MRKVFEFFLYLIHKQRGTPLPDIMKKKPKKHSVLPSMPWGRRQRMGKISKDELIDIALWLKTIKNTKDFKEDK